MAKKSGKNELFKKIISLDEFIIPKIIHILYLIGLVILSIVCVVMLVSGIANLNLLLVGGSILYFILGLLGLRIYAELMMVVFAIERNTRRK